MGWNTNSAAYSGYVGTLQYGLLVYDESCDTFRRVLCMTSPSTVSAPSLPAPIPTGDRAYVFFSSETIQGGEDADAVCSTVGIGSPSPLLGSGKVYRALRASAENNQLAGLAAAGSVVLDLVSSKRQKSVCLFVSTHSFPRTGRKRHCYQIRAA